jgi:hypothetical protein
MPVVITRIGKTVSAVTETGAVLRAHDCDSIPAAATLAMNLTSNQSFARWWAADGTPQPLERADPWLERYPQK